jgi:hypothetical protein
MSLAGGHLDALLAAGATAEQIVALVKADMAEREKSDEKRRAKDRERQQRKRHAESRGVTRTNADSRDPSPNENILTPTREEKPPPKGGVKKTDRGCRLPSNWEPQPLTGKAAEMVARWSPGELERELAKFKNYWPSKGANAARTDWQRTWVNWLISADERKQTHGERADTNPTATALARVQSALRSGGTFN